MNRGTLAIGLVIVVAAGVALYVATQRDDATSVGAAPAPRNADVVAGGGAPMGRERAGRAAPLLPSPGAANASDYMVGDVRVRDHRSGDHDKTDVEPVIHPPTGPRIDSKLSSEIARSMRGVVAECAALVPAGERGAKPRFEGQIKIAVARGSATITSAQIRLRDTTGDSITAAQQCLEQKVIGISTPSGNEPDIEDYGITLSLRLP
jgi:hypothetical protein